MLDETLKSTLNDAARKLTGPKKRGFMAKVAEDYFAGSARKAETGLGWNRQTVQLGLHERRCGVTCQDNYQARGRKKTEETLPNLTANIRALVDGQSQAEPRFKTTFAYTKVTAKAVLEGLIAQKGYVEEDLPCRQTMGTILNRMGYRLKKHKK